MKALHYWMGIGVVCASVVSAAWVADDRAKMADQVKDKMPEMPAFTAEEMEMMAKFAAAGAPGAQHAKLATRAGNWTYTNKFWMDPTKDAMTSEGKAEAKMILGGRYLSMKVSGPMMGENFEGVGITGYDNVKKKWVNTWFDNMSTGFMISEGSESADGKTCTMTGVCMCPMRDKEITMRLVEKFIDNDTWVMEMYSPDMNDKEFKNMEITYKRVK